jgi:septum formation inhibitor-activating ATPase MinD
LNYDRTVYNKVNEPEKKKHIIHKAIKWKKMLDNKAVLSMSEISRKESLTRARVTQIMNLLKLPAEMQEFLLNLENPREIRKFSERKLRNKQRVKFNSKHNKNEL